MSKRFYKAIIDAVENQNCTDKEVENLLNFFENTIKTTACTLARKAWFELSYATNAKSTGISEFSLMLEKQMIGKHEAWLGTFTNKTKNLKVLGSLERD